MKPALEPGALARAVISSEAMTAITGHPGFGAMVVAAMDGWAPHAEDDASMTRVLRDLGQYMAGVWAVQLHASPEGLSNASLQRLMRPLGISSRTRVTALVAYLQFVGLIRRDPAGDRGRQKAFAPTDALVRLFHGRFRRELAALLPIRPEVSATLAIWDEPGVSQAFVAAHGELIRSSFEVVDQTANNLDVFSNRNAGLTVLGQVVVAACPDGVFPPKGPFPLNQTDLARRVGVSRAHTREVLAAARKAGFILELADGNQLLSEALVQHVTALMAAYSVSLVWCAEQARSGAARRVATAGASQAATG